MLSSEARRSTSKWGSLSVKRLIQFTPIAPRVPIADGSLKASRGVMEMSTRRENVVLADEPYFRSGSSAEVIGAPAHVRFCLDTGPRARERWLPRKCQKAKNK